jgi:hypothetical protein
MCFFIPPSTFSQPKLSSSSHCPAKMLSPEQRQELAVQALAGEVPVTELAEQAQVSRKFIYEQKSIAAEALDSAFEPRPDDDKVISQLPVTKNWLRQFIIGLVLIAHCPLRGIVELLRDLFDHDISLGTVHNIVQAAVAPARQVNEQQDLSGVRVGAHDEIFQKRQPVLVGVDALTSYCYLLRLEAHRDADTWGVHLLDLQQRGWHPDTIVADAGSGLRSGLKAALPDVPCRSDVFHALKEVQDVATALENKAYRAMNACCDLERKIASRQHRGLPTDRSLVGQLVHAAKEQDQAIQLADELAWLARWLRQDVLALAGSCLADRLDLFDFIRTELEARVSQAPTLIRPLVTYLKNQRDDLLDFASQLDRDFVALANSAQVSVELVRELFAVQALDLDNPQRWHRDAPLRQILGERYFPLSQALETVRRRTVRASSVVENLNSRLRDYFFLRQMLGNDYLTLLQFFLNHRRFVRSEHPERVNKSPAELLTGRSHPHWLELLGYTRFSRN